MRTRFAARVDEAVRRGSSWDLRGHGAAGPVDESFDWLVNATGRSNVPAWPPGVGSPTYRSLHACDYGCLPAVSGATCLVIGNGSSGVDIACDLAAKDNTVDLSVRTPNWYVPKYLLGRPVSAGGARGLRHLVVTPVKKRLAGPVLRRVVGRQEEWGLPTPPSGPLDSVPVPSDLFLHAVRHRLVALRPPVRRLEAEHVAFSDGTSRSYDVVVSATGYSCEYAHLPPGVREEARSRGLLLGMFPEAPGGIAIMNGFRCRGAAVGCAELQARLACAAIAGRLEVRASSVDARLGPECARRGLSAHEYERFVRRRLPRRASRPLRRDLEMVG